MSARLRRNFDFIKVLRKCTPEQRKAILKLSSDDLIHALTECCLNVYLKTIKITPSVRKKLIPHKTDLKFVSDKRNPLNKRRQRFVQKGEGILPFILPVLVDQIASLLTHGAR